MADVGAISPVVRDEALKTYREQFRKLYSRPGAIKAAAKATGVSQAAIRQVVAEAEQQEEYDRAEEQLKHVPPRLVAAVRDVYADFVAEEKENRLAKPDDYDEDSDSYDVDAWLRTSDVLSDVRYALETDPDLRYQRDA